MNLSDQTADIAEMYVHAIRGRMYFEQTYNPNPVSPGRSKAWGIGHCGGAISPVTVKSRNLFVICAAGMANHWGTNLWRLKYGHDAKEFAPVLARFENVAAETSERLKWGDEELARFLARFVLLGWLLDRSFRGHGEWKRRCTILRQQLFRAEREAASLLALKLGH